MKYNRYVDFNRSPYEFLDRIVGSLLALAAFLVGMIVAVQFEHWVLNHWAH